MNIDDHISLNSQVCIYVYAHMLCCIFLKKIYFKPNREKTIHFLFDRKEHHHKSSYVFQNSFDDSFLKFQQSKEYKKKMCICAVTFEGG